MARQAATREDQQYRVGDRVRMDWGGVEAIFERGAAAGTRRKQDEIPPR